MRVSNDLGESRVERLYWGGIWAGFLVALGAMALLTSLWIAIGFGSGQNWVAGYLNWWIGVSGIFCAFLGGAVAGVYGRGSAPSGFMRGIVVWALLVVATGISAIPGLSLAAFTGSTLWTAFWALLIGLGAAAWGGTVTGGARALASSARYSASSSDDVRMRMHTEGLTSDRS